MKLQTEIRWWVPGGWIVYSGKPMTRLTWIRLTWRGYLAYWHLLYLVAKKIAGYRLGEG